MLTTNECLNLEDYAFKSSPESCSSNSYFTDYSDLPSDEDFLQQLSSDLDIPLLLNPGEDELSLLNSFFDKSPEEIMSEIALPASPIDDFNEFPRLEGEPPAKLHSEVKIEPSDSSSSTSSNKSSSPVQSLEGVEFFEIKDELKDEPHSPGSMTNFAVKTENDGNILLSTFTRMSPTERVKKMTSTRRVPIQPKSPYAAGKNKVVVIKNAGVASPPPPKVVVLENIATVPITTVTPVTQMTSSVTTSTVAPVILKKSNLPMIGHIDPKILKRQQRKIKNRESACLSRKKKKDYLTSLENQVKELTAENQRLKMQNKQLMERLTKYEGNQAQKKPSNVKTNIVLCMFLFSVAFHFDYIRNPLLSRNQVNLIPSDTPKASGHYGRNLLWKADDVVDKNTSNFLPFSMCPAAINQTESARLALELERWIGKPKGPLEKPPAADIAKLSPAAPRSKPLRKKKAKKFTTPVISSVYSVGSKLSAVESNNELQVFSPTPEQIYSEFFEEINRQDDTFYVVSFSDHHMLLPALHHNKTRRPKMSLIMPSMLSGENITQPDLVPLMQIDCEVLNTRLIQVRYGSIPEHLRRHDNSTRDEVSKPSDAASNYTHRKPYKPYFIKRKSVGAGGDPDFL